MKPIKYIPVYLYVLQVCPECIEFFQLYNTATNATPRVKYKMIERRRFKGKLFFSQVWPHVTSKLSQIWKYDTTRKEKSQPINNLESLQPRKGRKLIKDSEQGIGSRVSDRCVYACEQPGMLP